MEWQDSEVEKLGVQTGLPAHQTFWELLALACCLLVWGDRLAVDYELAVVGDNTGSLQCALDQKGRGAMNALSQELSWRRARHRWAFTLGHIPTESNKWADALSRLPRGVSVPPALDQARRLSPPSLAKFWATLPMPGRSKRLFSDTE